MTQWLGMIDLKDAVIEYNPQVFGEAILIKSANKDSVGIIVYFCYKSTLDFQVGGGRS